jgi:hypothetical protein
MKYFLATLILILPIFAHAQSLATSSQFCRDIAEGTIAFEDKNHEITYGNASYSLAVYSAHQGAKRIPKIMVMGNESLGTIYLSPLAGARDYNIVSYDGKLYAESYSGLSKYYFEFRPDQMAFELACHLIPINPVFTAVKPSKTCSQVIAGNYKKLEPQAMNAHVLKDNSENAKFMQAYPEHCADNMNGYDTDSMCAYQYLLADYNNDDATELLTLEEYVSDGGRGCEYDYFKVYDDGKFLLITTGKEDEEYFNGGRPYGKYQISCEGGAQELIKIGNTTYLLTKNYGWIEALHKISTRKDGLNDAEEICKFDVKYEYQ